MFTKLITSLEMLFLVDKGIGENHSPFITRITFPVMINENYLPIALPDVDKYLPTEDGKPPLGNSKDMGVGHYQ